MRRIFHGKVHKNPMFFSQNNKFMNKINNGRNTSDNSKKNVINNTTNNQFNGCNHVQLGGMAHYDERRYFMFAPDYCVPNMVQRVRRMCGVAQQMTDGTFEFVSQPKPRTQSKLIKKLAHGRISLTKDKAIQLTLKVMANENINIAEAIAAEAAEGANALIDYQLRR
mgnify:FL=1